MSKIDDLIKELCPDGVEFKQLGEICEIKTGAGVTRKDVVEEGLFPIISGGVYPLGMYNRSNCKAKTVTIARAGSAGYVDFIDKDFYLNDKCFSVIPFKVYQDNIDSRFLYFALKNIEQSIMDMKSMGSVPTVNTQKVSKIKIPIPPLEVQKEVVRVLDSFTELEAELGAELEARKKQYEYYRNDLLTSDESSNAVEQKLLGEVVRIKNGKDWKITEEGDVPVYGSGGRMSMGVDRCLYNKPTVLLPRKGTISNVFYVEEPFWNVDTVYYTEINTDVIIPKYFFYFMDNFNLSKLDTGSGRPSLTHAVLNKIQIPIPTISRQQQIVSILDKFEKLTSDISIGLPAEIEARRKQYEYYRNKLLTFKEV